MKKQNITFEDARREWLNMGSLDIVNKYFNQQPEQQIDWTKEKFVKVNWLIGGAKVYKIKQVNQVAGGNQIIIIEEQYPPNIDICTIPTEQEKLDFLIKEYELDNEPWKEGDKFQIVSENHDSQIFEFKGYGINSKDDLCLMYFNGYVKVDKVQRLEEKITLEQIMKECFKDNVFEQKVGYINNIGGLEYFPDRDAGANFKDKNNCLNQAQSDSTMYLNQLKTIAAYFWAVKGEKPDFKNEYQTKWYIDNDLETETCVTHNTRTPVFPSEEIAKYVLDMLGEDFFNTAYSQDYYI